MNKIYHIYVKKECRYHSLSEEEFHTTWNNLQKMTWVSDLKQEDLEYEEILTDSYIEC
jgi:hypothetical protein